MVITDPHDDIPRVTAQHRYYGMVSSTVAPVVVVTGNCARTPIEYVPKDLIPIGEVIQRRPTNRAERRAMKRGKNGR